MPERSCLRPRLSQQELRDDARQLLEAIAADMETSQTRQEQQDKSQGLRAGRVRRDGDAAATSHGAARLSQGFDVDQTVSEYRALRGSVIHLWTEKMGEVDRSMIDELTRFNEAIDEALTESIARYMQGISRSRDLVMAALGHDLRTPLGAIIAPPEIARRWRRLPPSHHCHMAAVASAGAGSCAS